MEDKVEQLPSDGVGMEVHSSLIKVEFDVESASDTCMTSLYPWNQRIDFLQIQTMDHPPPDQIHQHKTVKCLVDVPVKQELRVLDPVDKFEISQQFPRNMAIKQEPIDIGQCEIIQTVPREVNNMHIKHEPADPMDPQGRHHVSIDAANVEIKQEPIDLIDQWKDLQQAPRQMDTDIILMKRELTGPINEYSHSMTIAQVKQETPDQIGRWEGLQELPTLEMTNVKFMGVKEERLDQLPHSVGDQQQLVLQDPTSRPMSIKQEPLDPKWSYELWPSIEQNDAQSANLTVYMPSTGEIESHLTGIKHESKTTVAEEDPRRNRLQSFGNSTDSSRPFPIVLYKRQVISKNNASVWGSNNVSSGCQEVLNSPTASTDLLIHSCQSSKPSKSSVSCDSNMEPSHSPPRKKRIQAKIRIRAEAKHFKCSFCDFQSSAASSLTRHTRTHTGEKPYKCPVCAHGFTSRSGLTQHARSHTSTLASSHIKEKLNKCSFCDFRCTSKYSLTRHTRTHTGEMSYKCQYCDQRFSRRPALRQHTLQEHFEKKPYICAVCSRRFTSRSNLFQHTKTHHEEKPYTCPACDKSFTSRSNLSRHAKTSVRCQDPIANVHIGECAGRFSSLSDQIEHARTLHGLPYMCSQCDFGYKDSSVLAKHVATHDLRSKLCRANCNSSVVTGTRVEPESKLYKCAQCDYECDYLLPLEQHQTTHIG